MPTPGLQKTGPVGPGGFGQNTFGRTKGNFNSLYFGQNSQQIGHNSQQIGQTHCRLDKLTADWKNSQQIGQTV